MTAHYYTDISPDVLTAGVWVLDAKARIMRWEPGPEPVAPAPPVRLTVSTTVVCSTCNATQDDWCRFTSGKPRSPHPDRTSPRTCACGEPPMVPKARYCAACKAVRRRETFKASQERRMARREARLAELYDERFPDWRGDDPALRLEVATSERRDGAA